MSVAGTRRFKLKRTEIIIWNLFIQLYLNTIYIKLTLLFIYLKIYLISYKSISYDLQDSILKAKKLILHFVVNDSNLNYFRIS